MNNKKMRMKTQETTTTPANLTKTTKRRITTMKYQALCINNMGRGPGKTCGSVKENVTSP